MFNTKETVGDVSAGGEDREEDCGMESDTTFYSEEGLLGSWDED